MRRHAIVLSALLAALLFSIPITATAQMTRVTPCPVPDIFERAQRIAANMPVRHSEKVAAYTERQLTSDGGSFALSRTDYQWRTIPLVLINLFTCELIPTTITRTVEDGKVGTVFASDDRKFLVAVEPRVYGTLWNWWNTSFQVLAPEGFVVAGSHWKRHPSGASVVQTPFSGDLVLSLPHVVVAGREHYRRDEAEALLRLSRVRSRGVPGMDIESMLTTHFPGLLETLVQIEHADEFELAEHIKGNVRHNPLDRAFTLLGANPVRGLSDVKSPAGARGKFQITPPACTDVHRWYASANIPAGCTAEGHAHVIETTAAGIVVDYHLLTLRLFLGRKGETPEQFAARPEMLSMLKASFNGGPGSVIKAYRSRRWTAHLPSETQGYLDKAGVADKR